MAFECGDFHISIHMIRNKNQRKLPPLVLLKNDNIV